MTELNQAIKSMKRNKSLGPDNIPNEAYIEANQETRNIIMETMNVAIRKIRERINDKDITKTNNTHK